MRNSKTKTNIAEVMARLLDPVEMRKVARKKNVEDALHNLNQAVDILDGMGKFVLAEATTKVMSGIPSSLKKKAQQLPEVGALKYMIYLIEQTVTDISALVPNASEAVDDRDKRIIRDLNNIKERVGDILNKLDSYDDVELLVMDLKSHAIRLDEIAHYTLNVAANAFNSTDDKNSGRSKLEELPGHVRELADVMDTFFGYGLKAFFAKLEKGKRKAEEETGKDFDAPAGETERFKEHEIPEEEALSKMRDPSEVLDFEEKEYKSYMDRQYGPYTGEHV